MGTARAANGVVALIVAGLLSFAAEIITPIVAALFERRINTEARQRQLVRQLEALGNKVTLQPAA